MYTHTQPLYAHTRFFFFYSPYFTSLLVHKVDCSNLEIFLYLYIVLLSFLIAAQYSIGGRLLLGVWVLINHLLSHTVPQGSPCMLLQVRFLEAGWLGPRVSATPVLLDFAKFIPIKTALFSPPTSRVQEGLFPRVCCPTVGFCQSGR